jgi:hypothetical protein
MHIVRQRSFTPGKGELMAQPHGQFRKECGERGAVGLLDSEFLERPADGL